MMGLCRQDHTLTSTAQIRKSLDLLFILQSHCKIWKMDMGAFIQSCCPFFQCFWLSLFNLILLIGLLKWMTRPNLGQRLCDLCPSSVTFSEISSQTFGRRFSWAEWFCSFFKKHLLNYFLTIQSVFGKNCGEAKYLDASTCLHVVLIWSMT